MDWEPRVGMKVVCVDASPWCGVAVNELVQGEIYTIRSVELYDWGVWDHRGIGVRIAGIVRLPDAPFGAFRFKPLRERKTDISIFTALLTKAPTEKEPA